MSSPHARLSGLDGLRAIAVLLVVVYHVFPGSALRSGFIGVDVFFVVSGFLITTLLLREQSSTGRIAIGPFWRRRARRLLPALALVVTVSATAAWIAGGDVLVGLGRQILGAATFSYNWLTIADGGSYFSEHEPELLRNLWSLAVEEQFYLLWPLVLPLLLLLPGRLARVSIALVAAAASALWAVWLIGTGASPTRVYFGTDTHAFGLLLGVALAFVGPQRAARRPSIGGVGPAWGVVIGAVSILGLVMLASTSPGDGVATFPGVLVAASICSAAALIAGVRPGSWFGRAMDAAPLRWIGERSYGLYLWHWPLLVLMPASTVVGGAGVLALTFVIAALSYRFVELPIRRHGLRGAVRGLSAKLRSAPVRRSAAVASSALVVALLVGTAAAIVSSPRVSSGQAVVEAGQAALDAARAADRRTPDGADAPDASDGVGDNERPGRPGPGGAPLGDLEGSGDVSEPVAPVAPSAVPGKPGTTSTPPPFAPPTLAPVPPADAAPGSSLPPAPAPIDGSRISAVGDSVMLASAPALLERLDGIQIDAAVSRSMYAAPGILRDLVSNGALREYVVIALGTNGPVVRETLDEVLTVVGPERTLILVTAYAPRDWITGVNAELVAFADAHPNVVLADWTGAVSPRLDLLAEDDVHPGQEGGELFADVIAGAVEHVEGRRAQLRYRLDLALLGIGAILPR